MHRVQRVPVTESQGRIHTSAATVAVLPEVEEVEVELDPDELTIETCRASGPGGQHMQKNDTAVRIIHKPSGIVVTCQDERSQVQNRQKALRFLRAKLYEIAKQKQADEINSTRAAAKWDRVIAARRFAPTTIRRAASPITASAAAGTTSPPRWTATSWTSWKPWWKPSGSNGWASQ